MKLRHIIVIDSVVMKIEKKTFICYKMHSKYNIYIIDHVTDNKVTLRQRTSVH